MQRHALCAVLIAILLSATASGQDERGIKVVPREQVRSERAKRWAVLIGVDKYEDEIGIGSLKYCGQDMKLLYQVLTGPNGGFSPENVLLMTENAERPLYRPTRSNIVRMVPNWLKDAKPDDDVLIAFSGHGIEEDGQGYLLPRDAVRANPRLTALPVSLFQEWLAACKAGRKILIIDACHAGAGKAATSMSEALWEQIDRGEGFMRLASCGPKQKSNEDEELESNAGKGHGVFTYYLAEGLKGKADYDRDGRVDIDEAYRYAYNGTRGWARRSGVEQAPMKSGAVTGIMTIGYYRSLEELQREQQVAEARMKELTAESGRAGTEAARKVIGEAWEKEREALRLIDERLKALEAGATDAGGVVAQYRVAIANVESIERELAAKRRTYTGTSTIVMTLEQRLAEAKDQQERAHQDAIAQLLATCQALQRQREEMAKEMLSTHPKMKQTDEQICGAARDLVDLGGTLPTGIPLGIDLGDGMTLKVVRIPPGVFTMGSPAEEKDRNKDEGPQHRVRIKQGIYMGATEITQAQYEAVMQRNPSRFEGADRPVERVSWKDAQEFCKRVSEQTGRTVRLPTEAEWEYACRAGTSTPFGFGDTMSTDQANYDGDYRYETGQRGVNREETVPVGRLAANAWGLYDMHGNVWEWCSDWYESEYYTSRSVTNPQGARKGDMRVSRGGSWLLRPGYCRAANRQRDTVTHRSSDLGFRVVVDIDR